MKLMIAGGFAQSVGGAAPGLIAAYTGTSAPSGWTFCDGSNGAPDLRNKFVIGAGNTYAVGAQGGENTNTLAAHYHSYPDYHQHGYSGSTGGSSGQAYGITNSGAYLISPVAHTHSISVITGYGTSFNTGNNNESINTENQPPYYTLAFIMKTA